MVEELCVDAGVIVADGDGEGGVAVTDKVDIGTVIEEVIEDWQNVVLTGIVKSLIDTHFVPEIEASYYPTGYVFTLTFTGIAFYFPTIVVGWTK